MKKITAAGFFSLIYAFAGGCSFISDMQLSEEERELSGKALTVDLFSARGFLGGSDYERYYLKDNVLWRECGTVSPNRSRSAGRAKEGDSVLSSDPNLTAETRRVENVSAEQLLEIKKQAKELVESNGAASASQKFPLPESVFSITKSGVFELRLQLDGEKRSVVTSVDAVADSESNALIKTNRLYALLRGVGPVMCDAQTFFGIRRTVLSKK